MFQGRVQPASGALRPFHLKADVKSKHFLVDDKTTDADSFRLQMKLWRKLSNEAWSMKRRPVIRVEFISGPTLYVIDELTMQELIKLKLNATQQ